MPARVTAGVDYPLQLNWSGLAAGSSNFGGVLFYRGEPGEFTLLGYIPVTVRPRPAAVAAAEAEIPIARSPGLLQAAITARPDRH